MLESGKSKRIDATPDAIKSVAMRPDLISLRVSLANFTANHFQQVGSLLHLEGHIIGSDRASKKSPFGHGSDEVVAVSMLLRIGAQLISASTDLFMDGRSYAAATLIRQMVEIEYLAWAFASRNHDAERWLRSDQKEREEFFKPAKLRAAAQGKFRGKDYSYHCNLGGHPTPMAAMLLADDPTIAQLLLSDVLGHAGQIWNHIVAWAKSNNEDIIRTHSLEISAKFKEWTSRDLLVDLPPPP